MHAYMIKIIHNYHVQASVQIPFILDVFIAAIRLFIDIIMHQSSGKYSETIKKPL